MLKAAGFTDEDLSRPIVGVANTWIEIGPCNFHLRRLAAKVKEGIRAAGGTPMEFNTVSISDGISMGAEGMKASLISREVIADSIELVARGNHFDALVCISGCDKTNPGVVMALARLNIPGLVLYGGSIAPGHLAGRDLTIQDVFEAVGAYGRGKISAEQLKILTITGLNFSGVTVHTDAQADQLNRSLNARAFTSGQDIYFNVMVRVKVLRRHSDTNNNSHKVRASEGGVGWCYLFRLGLEQLA